MQSAILKKCARFLRILNIWFSASVTGKAFNRVSRVLATAFAGSLPGRFFTPSEGGIFRESLFCKVLLCPVTLCRLFGKKISYLWVRLESGSSVFWCLDNWHSISIRIYGMILLSFSVFYGIFRYCFSTPTAFELIILGVLILFAVFMILVNRSLKSLFKGSLILTAIGGLFCEIKPDSDSKLFLKDPEFFLSRPVAACIFGAVLALCACLVSPLMFCLIVGGLLFVLLTFKHTIFGVFCVIIASPILPTMALVGAALLCVVSFFFGLITGKVTKLRPVPLGGFIAFFMLALTVSTLLSFTFKKSLSILLIYLAFVLFYVVAFQVLGTEKKWKGALISLLAVSGFVALYGVYQNFAGISGTASWVDQEMFKDIKTRVYSTFGNPNVLGEFLVMMIPLSLAVLWKSKTDGQKFIYAAVFLALAACMIFTWSRGAWLGVMLAGGLFLLITDKRWALLAVFGVMMLPMLLGSDSAIANRILSIGNTKDTSTAYRVSIWQASLTMIRDFWISGIGLGSDAFSMIYPKYALAGANFALHSHNLFLQIMVESGMMGIITFLLLVIAFIRRNLSGLIYSRRSSLRGAVAIALTAGILGFLFQGLTDNVWYNYKMVLIFWIVLALASSPAAPDFDGGADR